MFPHQKFRVTCGGSAIGDKRGGGDDGKMVRPGAERLEPVRTSLALIGTTVSADLGSRLRRTRGGVSDGTPNGAAIQRSRLLISDPTATCL